MSKKKSNQENGNDDAFAGAPGMVRIEPDDLEHEIQDPDTQPDLEWDAETEHELQAAARELGSEQQDPMEHIDGKAVVDHIREYSTKPTPFGANDENAGALSKPVSPKSSDSTSEKVQRVSDGKSADTTLEEGAEEIWQDFKSAMSEGGFAFGRKRIERDFKGRPEAVLEDTAEKKRFLRFSKASCLKRFFPYVWALILGTAVRIHCEENDVNVTNLDVAHLIELAAEKDHLARLELAEEAQNKLLTASEIRLRVRARRKGPETAADSDLCGLAQSVIAKLDDPLALSDDEDCREILLDSAQVRAEFNFREQSKIYDKAERAKQHHLKLKGQIEQRLEELQQSINFLEDLMGAFDGKEPDSKTTA